MNGLNFPSNGTANSDIRLIWSGANYLPRYPHTAIWRVNYSQQTGYYAVTWHADIANSFDPTSYFQFGAHPYPSDGTYSAVTGEAQSNGDSTVHYMESAGNPNKDVIALPMEPAFQITKGVWYTQARVAYQSGTDIIHRTYPDVDNNPSKYIEVTVTKSSVDTDETAATSPVFYFGASHWQAGVPSAGQNDETISGILRGMRLFDTNLSITDIQAESAAIGDDTAASSAGQANTWYINDNPTPTDVTDKSGSGHNPLWNDLTETNTNRPSLYTG